jgi:hypothetical protein
MELLKAKGEANIAPLLMEILQSVAPEIFTELKSDKTPIDDTTADFNVTTTATLFATILPTIEKISNTLTGLVVEGAFKISDLAAVLLMSNLGSSRKNQIASGISDQNYELMIDDLRRLELIEPKLQVSLCPECLNYELVISKYPSTKKICPKCGKQTVVTTLYLFKDQLGKIKSRNDDLPLFISAFLKQKLVSPMFLSGGIGIYPLEQIELDDEKKSKVEVDVRIPKLNLGIECKLFETPIAPMTEQRTNSIASNLLVKIQKYGKVGINDVVIITNLSEANIEKVDKSLKVKLNQSRLSIKYELLSGDIDKLIDFLNSIVKYINETIGEDFSKNIERHPLGLGLQTTDKESKLEDKRCK